MIEDSIQMAVAIYLVWLALVIQPADRFRSKFIVQFMPLIIAAYLGFRAYVRLLGAQP